MNDLATLGLADASRRPWDVITVGAGPAGALAARELARRGVSVLLVDRAAFPRHKVCGCCLNPWALATLAKVGLDGVMRDGGAVPLDGMLMMAGGRQAFVPRAGSVALSRRVLDTALVDAAVAAGAHFLPGTWARLGHTSAGSRQLTLRGAGAEASAQGRVLLAADGLGGTFCAGAADLRAIVTPQSRLGAGTVVAEAPADYVPGTIYMACAAAGYVGLVRLEDGTLNVAGALDAAEVRRQGGVGPAAVAVLAAAGFPPVPPLADAAWRATPPLTRRVGQAAAERVFLLGDAAGYVEPFTGEGIAWALACGAAIAPIAHRACHDWTAALSTQWSSRYRRTISRRQWACRAIAWMLRRPLIVSLGIKLFRQAPVLFAPLLHFLDGPPARRCGTTSSGSEKASAAPPVPASQPDGPTPPPPQS